MGGDGKCLPGAWARFGLLGAPPQILALCSNRMPHLNHCGMIDNHYLLINLKSSPCNLLESVLGYSDVT